MCSFFSVSRSGYYDFVRRINIPDRDEPLKALIEERRAGRYVKILGCRRIQLWLVQKKHLHYPNLLNRNFETECPNQKWVTDISYIQTPQGTLYLSAIRDLFDGSIVSYLTSTLQNCKLVLDTVKAAMKKEKVTAELQLHSDQGFQYTSQGYFALTQKYSITPSLSRRANPYDNAMAEIFFGMLKTECIYLCKPQTIAEAKFLIDDYIEYFNNERICLKTKLTPREKRCQLA